MELEKDQAITQLATANRQKNTLQTKLDQIEDIIGANPTNAQLQNLVDAQNAVNHSGQSLDDIHQLYGKNVSKLIDKEAELNTIEYFLTDLRDALGIIDSTKLQDYQKSIRLYNNDLSRLKKQTERVLNRFRNDQGINDNDLNNQLAANLHMPLTGSWENYIDNATDTADLGQRKLNVLNAVASLIITNPNLNDAIIHAKDQADKAITAFRDTNNIIIDNTEITSELQTNGHIADPSHTWQNYLENATDITDAAMREKNVLLIVSQLGINKANNNHVCSVSCSHSDYDTLKTNLKTLSHSRNPKTNQQRPPNSNCW